RPRTAPARPISRINRRTRRRVARRFSRSICRHTFRGRLRLLKLSDQDTSASCHTFTAVVNQAASGAADLLSSGDYAVAYPSAKLLYHGTQTEDPTPLTVERTSMLGWYLRLTNDRYAMALARKSRSDFRSGLSRTDITSTGSARRPPSLR